MNYLEIAKEILENNWIVGVRTLCDDEQYAVGDDCRASYEWDIEEDCSTYHTTGETAVGTCATHIETGFFRTDDEAAELAARIEEAVAKNKAYGKAQQVVIAGHSVNNDGYFDAGEIRIVDAFVVAVIA